MVEQAIITEDEAALYDRQIRLWGLDAQRRYTVFEHHLTSDNSLNIHLSVLDCSTQYIRTIAGWIHKFIIETFRH